MRFIKRAFGFRHGRSAHDALRIVEQKIHRRLRLRGWTRT